MNSSFLPAYNNTKGLTDPDAIELDTIQYYCQHTGNGIFQKGLLAAFTQMSYYLEQFKLFIQYYNGKYDVPDVLVQLYLWDK